MAIPPVKTSANLDLSASSGADKSVKAHAGINAPVGSQNQNSEAFQNVNQQLGRNNSQGNQNNQAAHGNSEGNNGNGNSAHASMQGSVQVSQRGNGNHNGHHQRGSSDAPRSNGNQGNQGNNGNHGVHHANHANHGSQAAPQSNQNEVGDGGRGNGNGNGYAYGRAEGRGNDNGNGNGGNNKGGNPLNININFSANAQTSGNNPTGNNNQTSGNVQINVNNQTSGNNRTGSNNQTTAQGQINNNSTQGNGNGRGNAYGHVNRSSQGHANHSTQGQINYSTTQNARQQQSTSLDLNLSLNLNRNGDNGNHNGIVRSVLNQVLRQNDIYLNQNVIRHFVNENIGKPANGNGNHYGSRQNVSIPPEITQIVRTIRTQITSVLNNPSIKFNGNVRINIQHSPELSNLIHTSKNVLLQNFGAKPFINLNLNARMHIAAELILRYLSKSQANVLLNHSAKQILNGLLLARGFAITADKFYPRHDIFSAKKFPLPYNVPPVVIRNLGNAVKSLIVEARLAQTPKDLEVAVQKFLRHPSGKNNPDALLSAVKLAGQFGVRGNAEGEAALPEKIAELVKFLILTGDKALQSVADAFDAAEAELSRGQNTDNSAGAESTELERNYETIRSGDNSAEAEGALRRQLEFNPFFQNDRAASAFENPSEASRAQEEFSNRFHNEIEQWLQSGNHRFVKDIELEKPIGIVVERGTSGFFTADKARIVLVRDGSVQGWHFLKSFLVK
jgi:hypothetical protein